MERQAFIPLSIKRPQSLGRQFLHIRSNYRVSFCNILVYAHIAMSTGVNVGHWGGLGE